MGRVARLSAFAVAALLTCAWTGGGAFAQESDDGAAAVAEFEAAIKEADPTARAAAAKTLATAPGEKAAQRLGKLLAGDKSEAVRIATAEALGTRAGDKEALKALAKGANANVKVQPVLIAILRAIGAIGLPDGAKMTEPFLKHPDEFVVRAAIEGAGGTGHPGIVEPLVEMFAQMDGGADMARRSRERVEDEYQRGRMGQRNPNPPPPPGPPPPGQPPGQPPPQQAPTQADVERARQVEQEAQTRLQNYSEPLNTALAKLTGQSNSTGSAWAQWWKENGRAFLSSKKQ